MKFGLILLMAFVLVGVAGADSGPITLRNDGYINTNGGDIYGSEFVDEADVDWSGFKYRIFNGTTEAELEAFITAHGSGTYYINQPVEISDQWVIDEEFVRFVCPYPGSTWSNGRARFNITTTTNPAIYITNQMVTFEDCMFDAYNTSTTNTLVRIDANHCHFYGCDWLGNSANGGVVRITEAFGTHLIDPNIVMPAYTGNAKAIVLHSTNASRHNLATYISGTGYSRGIYYGDIGIYAYGYVEAPFLHNLMLYKASHGIYMVPTANESICNVEIDHCNPDFAQGGHNGLTLANDAGSYTVARFRITDSAFYTYNDGAYCIEIKVPVEDFRIHGGYYQSGSERGAILMSAASNNFSISDAEIKCTGAGDGIQIAANSSDFSIVNNLIRTSGGTGITINADCSDYILALNNANGGITDTPGAMVTTGNIVA